MKDVVVEVDVVVEHEVFPRVVSVSSVVEWSLTVIFTCRVVLKLSHTETNNDLFVLLY